FFVTNCDILISADYASIYEFHLEGGYDISLVASAKEYVIPYGTCEITGKAIPQTRLNAIPWARFRVDAQSELEQHGILQNRSLGQLGTITTPAASTKDRVEKELPETKTKKD
ncbi:MAG: TraR/DksA C4-type zinc finger protein, partial [Verrucomicrobiota bacterium]|nr:TraR/DksA C4-type zinc finger protein [Verrucomicrobiota bacterium]